MNSAENKNWLKQGKAALDIEIEGIQAVRDRLGPEFSDAVNLLAGCKGRVIISGLGKSGLVGRKLAATLSSTGTPSFFMHPVEAMHGDLGSIRQEDVLIAISNSGHTDELNAILPALRSLGVKILALTGGAESTLASLADVVINTAVPREACPLNLAPTTSTTAVLAVGDALAVCLIECRSFTEKDFRRVHPGGSLGRRLKLHVDDIMRRDGLPIAPLDSTQAEALDALHRGGMGLVMLVDGLGKTAGVLSDGDVRRAFVKGRLDSDAPVSGIMTGVFQYAVPGQLAAELLDKMENRAITVLPVLDGDKKPLGIVHLHDLLGKGAIKFS